MKREYIVMLILVVLITALIIAYGPFFRSTKDISDTNAFVIEDLKQKYPNADIEIISTKEKTNDAGTQYYEIKAKVTKGQNGLCPERIHIYYNYPEQNFIPQTPEYITTGCAVCKEGICNIVFPEEAIIASHTLPDTEDVHEFITTNKNPQVVSVSENADGWLIVWDTDLLEYQVSVQISKDGKVLSKTKVFTNA